MSYQLYNSLILEMASFHFKGLVHPKMKMMSLITQLHVVTNP